MKTPKTPRTSKMAFAKTPMTPQEHFVASVLEKNNEGRREEAKLLTRYCADLRKQQEREAEERKRAEEAQKKDREERVKAQKETEGRLFGQLAKHEDGCQRDAEMAEKVFTPGPPAARARAAQSSDSKGEVKAAGTGLFSKWFGFKSPVVKSPQRRPKSSEKEEESEEDHSDVEKEAGESQLCVLVQCIVKYGLCAYLIFVFVIFRRERHQY